MRNHERKKSDKFHLRNFLFLRQVLTVQSRLALNSQPFCLSPSRAGVTDMHHYILLKINSLFVSFCNMLGILFPEWSLENNEDIGGKRGNGRKWRKSALFNFYLFEISKLVRLLSRQRYLLPSHMVEGENCLSKVVL